MTGHVEPTIPVMSTIAYMTLQMGLLHIRLPQTTGSCVLCVLTPTPDVDNKCSLEVLMERYSILRGSRYPVIHELSPKSNNRYDLQAPLPKE